jgi:creatinine amidohydrolase/Fe(II)-dependent formamide hydrolase-like protein
MVMMTAGSAYGADNVKLYHEMTKSELQQAIQACPVAYYPAGINEWHGEQSAVGLDALKAESLARLASEHLGGVCFPTNWIGPGGSTPFDPEKYPRGTLTIDRKLYEQGAEHVLAALEKMGFKVAVYLSGHYPCEIHEIAGQFNERGGMQVISVTENMVVDGMPAGDHAGTWETTMLHVLRPGLVDLSRLPPLPEGVEHAGQVIPPPWEFRQRCEYYGIYGSDPRIWVNDHYGHEATHAFLAGLGKRIGGALNDTDFGKGPFDIDWPKRDLPAEEVRYDFQLPSQWIERFHKAPVIYWPLPAIGPDLLASTDTAIAWAKQTGGMVFPAFPYGPTEAGDPMSFDTGRFVTMVREAITVLADMDFRVITLLVDDRLTAETRRALAAIQPENDQYRVIVTSDDAKDVPAKVKDAITATIPPSDAAALTIDGQWTINDQRSIRALRENPYGPGDVRVYEITFKLTNEQAARNALLDLGDVRNHAEVILNGQKGMIDHWPTYRFLVTGKLKEGENKLKVIVHHKPQPTLDTWFYRPAPPQMTGPVRLLLW